MDSRILLAEAWDAFDESIWTGDGDQLIAGGLFTALDGAGSAAADWSPGDDGMLGGRRRLRFANELAADGAEGSAWRQALFFISGDADESYRNYLFVYVRYSRTEGAITLESFGASGGVDFDQLVDLPWSAAADAPMKLEVEVEADRYRMLVDGRIADSVALVEALARVAVFEVGVQSGPEGEAGQIERTTVSLETPRAGGFPGFPDRPGFVRCHRRHVGPAERHARARHFRERLSHCAHPSSGLKALARGGL